MNIEKGTLMDKVRIQELWDMTPENTKADYALLDALIAKGTYKKVGK